jgi:PI31 proteasome regulator N-terminal/PI31 proteasome regulator
MAEPGVRGMLSWLHSVGHVPADGHEALALAVHGLLVQHGFRPHDQADASEQPRLPAQWGAAGFGGRYRHHRSALTFDVRAVAVGPRLVVHATIVEEDEVLHSLELRVDRYVRRDVDFSALAVPANAEETRVANQTESPRFGWDDVFENPLDLATLVQVNIAHRLVPDAAKDGYEAAAEAGTVPSAAATATATPAGGSSSDAGRPGYRPPYRPDEDDPLRIGPPMRPGRNPYGLPGIYPGGDDDLMDPSPYGLGHDDLIAPGLPRPLGGRGLGGLGGGNLMGPRHPAFGAPRGGIAGPPRVPGARFDPFGPPDPYSEYGPGGGGGDGIPRGGPLGGQPQPRPRAPNRGEPDNDIERPAPPDNDHGVPDGPPPDMYW